MNKLMVNKFEKYIINKVAIFVGVSFIVLTAFVSINMSFNNSILKDILINNRILVMEIVIPVLMGLILILMGTIWLIGVVRRDKNQMFHLLGTSDSAIIFEEFTELSSAYDNKMAELKELKETYAIKVGLIKTLEKELKSESITFKNILNRCEIQEIELSNLKDFFDKIAEKLPSLIWITDYHGNLLYKNSHLEKKFENTNMNLNTIYDILNFSSAQFEMFRNRNFNNVLLYLKDQNSVSGKNIRIFENETLKYILFISETSNQEKVMNRSYLKKSRDLHFINEISKIISGQITIDSTLQDAIEKIAFLGNFNSCSIRLINENQELVLKAFSGYIKEYVLGNKVETGNSHIGYAFNENKILTINTIDDMLFDDPAVKKIILDNRKIAYIPLTNYSKTLGVMSILSEYDFDSESLILLDSISINVTIALEKILLYEQLKSNYFKTVEAFVTASEIKSEKYSGHSRRVAQICRIIAEKLYLSGKEIDEIYMAGLLHDVGKLAFSDNSLNYYFDTDNHGAIGRTMVERVGLTKDILEGIEHHHLDFDLKNSKDSSINEQPYYAQIIRIANDFDLYMNYETTNILRPNFILDMQKLTGSIYSPQFMRIMTDLLENENSILLQIYQNEVINEDELL